MFQFLYFHNSSNLILSPMEHVTRMEKSWCERDGGSN